MTITNSNMVTKKRVQSIRIHSISYFIVIRTYRIVTFADITFVTLVNILFVTFVIHHKL